MSGKPPAFQFYPQDYLASTRVAEMTLEEEGVYIRLLCYCWSAGSIPADPERCARLAGKGCTVETATVVQRAFNEHPTDHQRLVHDRLEIERENQRLRREQASSAGKKSAERRAKRPVETEETEETPAKTDDFNDRSTTVQRNVNPSSSSSSSSSSSKEESHVSASFIAAQYVAAIGGKVLVTDKRLKAIKARWKDPFWRENWQQALDVASSTPFLQGQNESGWKINFDWFLKPDSVAKIIEGNYEGSKHVTTPQKRPTAAEQREALNASGFERIRRAAALASGDHGGSLSASTGKTLFLEEHSSVDPSCV